MRKIYKYFAAMALTVSVAACNKETAPVEKIEENTESEYILNAYIDDADEAEPESKTELHDDGLLGKSILWRSSETITVYSANSDNYTFTQKDGAGTTNAKFSCATKPDFKKDNEYSAVYPAHLRDGKQLSWPSGQSRTLYHPEIIHIPMISKGSIENDVLSDAQFTCLGGVMRINVALKSGDLYLRKIVVKADQPLSGPMTLDNTDPDHPVAVINPQNGNKSVTLTLEGVNDWGMRIIDSDGYHTCNISVPVSPSEGYTNMTLYFYDRYGNEICRMKSPKPIPVQRAKITTLKMTIQKVNRPGLTLNDPVGTIGEIGGRKAIVVELGGVKKAIALENEGATSSNPIGTLHTLQNNPDHSTPDCHLKRNISLSGGWRLPMVMEYMALAELPSTWDSSNKCRTWNIAGSTLSFPVSGISCYCASGPYDVVFDNSNVPVYQGLYTVPGTGHTDYFTGTCYIRAIRDLPFFPEQPSHELSADDPVGTIGTCKGREAIVLKLLGRKVAMATTNLEASTPEGFGTEYTLSSNPNDPSNWWNISLHNGWRLPIAEEMTELLAMPSQINWNQDESRFYQEWVFSETTSLKFPTYCYEKYAFGTQDRSKPAYYALGEPENCFETVWGTGGPGRVLHVSLPDCYIKPIFDLEETVINSSTPDGTRCFYKGRLGVVATVNGKKLLVSCSDCNTVPGDHVQYTPRIAMVFWDLANDMLNADRWGSGWRMMTKDEITYVATKLQKEDNSYIWTIGDNKLTFLYRGYLGKEGIREKGSAGYYWTSTSAGSEEAWCIKIAPYGTSVTTFSVQHGFAVRLVHEIPN